MFQVNSKLSLYFCLNWHNSGLLDPCHETELIKQWVDIIFRNHDGTKKLLLLQHYEWLTIWHNCCCCCCCCSQVEIIVLMNKTNDYLFASTDCQLLWKYMKFLISNISGILHVLLDCVHEPLNCLLKVHLNFFDAESLSIYISLDLVVEKTNFNFYNFGRSY